MEAEHFCDVLEARDLLEQAVRGQRMFRERARLLFIERRAGQRAIESVFRQTHAADHVQARGQLEAPRVVTAEALRQVQHVALNALVARENLRRHQHQHL